MTGHVVRNLSPHPQAAWADLAIPFAEGERLAPHGTVHGHPWVKGRAIGIHSRIVHVRLPAGVDTLHIADTAAFEPGPVEPFTLTDWLTDDIAGLFPAVTVHLADGTMQSSPWPTPKLVDHNAAKQTYHVRDRVGEWVFDCYLGIYSGQDVIEISGTMTWSDPRTPALQTEVAAILIDCDEFLWLDETTPNAFDGLPGGGGYYIARDIRVGDAQQIRFHGAVLCVPEVPAWTMLSKAVSDPATNARMRNLVARTQGRVEAIGEFNGHWLAFGQTPDTHPTDADYLAQLQAQAGGLLSTGGSYWDAKPWGLAKYPGQTGDQEDFGATKSVALATLKDPTLLPFARYCISEPQRPIHHREPDGSPIRIENHPQLVMDAQRAHWNEGVSPDRLGKKGFLEAAQANGWRPKDQQHNSMHRLAELYALTGDHVLEQLVRDEAEAFLARSPAALDAPRAQGRSLLSAVECYLLTGDQRIWTRIVDQCQRAADGLTQGKVRVLEFYQDPRGLVGEDGKPVDTWSVWQHGLALVGYCAVLNVAEGIVPASLHTICDALADTIANHGFHEHAPCTLVRYAKDGIPRDRYGKQGYTAMGGFDPAWTFAGLHAYANVRQGGPTEIMDAVAQRLAHDQHAGTVRDREWRATRRSR